MSVRSEHGMDGEAMGGSRAPAAIATRPHTGRTAVAVVALAEPGALGGAAACWLAFVGIMLAHPGGGGSLLPDPQALLGTLLLAVIVGAPAGAVALPVLGLTILRHTPLHRALGFPFVGALLGIGLAVHAVLGMAIWPSPVEIPLFGVAGMVLGAIVARTDLPGRLASRIRRALGRTVRTGA